MIDGAKSYVVGTKKSLERVIGVDVNEKSSRYVRFLDPETGKPLQTEKQEFYILPPSIDVEVSGRGEPYFVGTEGDIGFRPYNNDLYVDLDTGKVVEVNKHGKVVATFGDFLAVVDLASNASGAGAAAKIGGKIVFKKVAGKYIAQRVDNQALGLIAERSAVGGVGTATRFPLRGVRVNKVTQQTGAGGFWSSADEAYSAIRLNKTDVNKISTNTGIKPENIQKVKDHLFVNEHTLDRYVDLGIPAKNSRFDSDIKIAESWKRLENGTHTPSDIQLLKHEIAERWIEIKRNCGYCEAHDRASMKFPPPDWWK